MVIGPVVAKAHRAAKREDRERRKSAAKSMPICDLVPFIVNRDRDAQKVLDQALRQE